MRQQAVGKIPTLLKELRMSKQKKKPSPGQPYRPDPGDFDFGDDD